MYTTPALMRCDSYKLGHADQYPASITKVISNFTPRSAFHFRQPGHDYIVWAGIQGFLIQFEDIWENTFFGRDKEEVLVEYAEFVKPFVGPKGFNMQRIRDLYDLGFLPLRISALPEGTIVPIGTPCMFIENTHEDFAWLTNFIETWISADLWKASTSATIAYKYRKILDEYVEITGSSKEFADWQIHDFSVRGMSGIEDAASTGYGHLLSSLGTDNLPAVNYVQTMYAGHSDFIGGSVPATEHSVMCAGGNENELQTFSRLIETYPSGVVSIVSDTWDFWNVITNIAAQLREKILARTPDELGLAKVVFRPDSGDPVKIITGYFPDEYEYDFVTGKYYDNLSGEEISVNEVNGAVSCLEDVFGTTKNDKGYKTLNPRVGLIYGDSITLDRAKEILHRLERKGYAADNVVFGVGSYTYQMVTRDTFSFAIKATYVELDGIGKAIFKDPITDNGTKKSLRGLICVSRNADGKIVVKDNVSAEEYANNSIMETMFLNASYTVRMRSIKTLGEIRAYLKSQ